MCLCGHGRIRANEKDRSNYLFVVSFSSAACWARFVVLVRFIWVWGMLLRRFTWCLHTIQTFTAKMQREKKHTTTERQRQNHLNDKHSAEEYFRQILMVLALSLVRSLVSFVFWIHGWPVKYWPISTIPNRTQMYMCIWENVPSNRNEWAVSEKMGFEMEWRGVDYLCSMLIVFASFIYLFEISVSFYLNLVL